ncbi:DUF6261 family protein [Parabacteroides sp.]
MGLAKQIGNISKTSLSNTAHMNMNTELYNRIIAYTPAALKLDTLTPLYKKALDTEGECVNRITKSATTSQLVDKDKERDNVFIFINSQVNSFLDCPDKPMQQAAAILNAMLRAYDKIYKKAFSEETAAIDGLLRDMEDESRKTAAQTLNLTTYFAKLKTLNEEYKTLDASRTDEYSSRVKTDTLSARKVTDNIWAQIAQKVNALAVLEPIDTILLFIDIANQIFRKYKDLIAAKGGANSPSKPEPAPTPEPDPDPTPDPDPDDDRPVIE